AVPLRRRVRGINRGRAMKDLLIYVDLEGREHTLMHLDADERKLVEEIRRRAAQNPDWCGFHNYWFNAVAQFYDARGVSRKHTVLSTVYFIAQDLSGRIGLETGMMLDNTYRSDL